MKKTLVVMRHGKAMSPAEDLHDIDRVLTEAGRMALEARLPYMLRLLKTKGSTVQIWSSPAKRARQTAALLNKALQEKYVLVQKDVELHDCLWEQDVDAFLDELRASDAEFVFAVGHIPFAEDVVEDLVGASPIFSTGALGCMDVRLLDADAPDDSLEQDEARLLWFVQGPVAKHWNTFVQLQAALAKSAKAVEDHREAFFADPDDIETNHHFRTNIRRLRSLVAFVKPWQNKEQNAEAQAILKSIVGHTSLLRELDVFEKQVRANPDSSPELLEICKDAASAERARVLNILELKQVTKSFERAMSLVKNVVWKKRYAKHGLPKCVVRARYDAMIDSVKADLDTLDLSDEERTHDVRKRAKRARYVAELNTAILGADTVDVAKGMTAHQDNLGDVCDARANIRLVDTFLQQDLPESVKQEFAQIRAQNEDYLLEVLKPSEAAE